MNRGVALIFTLVVVGLMAVLIIEFSYISRVNTKILTGWENERRAYFLAKGGINFGIYLLNMDNRGVDSLLDDWATEIPPLPVGDGVIELGISDEDGKVNVNRLASGEEKLNSQLNGIVLRLLDILDVEPSTFPGLFDYPGGEEASTLSVILDNGDSGRFFYTKDEFLNFPGIEDDGNFDEFFTVYSSGMININTAPLPVIQSLSEGISEELAREIFEYRSKTPFGSVAHLGKVPGVTGGIVQDVGKIGTVKSSFFTIESTATVNDIRKSIVAVIERTDKGLDVVYWSGGN